MIPIEPALISRPIENDRLYPSFSIAGSMIFPTAMTVAGLEPEIAEKNIELVTVVMPSPPSIGRTSAFANLISLCDMPPCAMMFPAKMKKGIAMRGNLSIPEKEPLDDEHRWVAVVVSRTTITGKSNTTKTGTLKTSNTISDPKRLYASGYPQAVLCATLKPAGIFGQENGVLNETKRHEAATDRDGEIDEPHRQFQGGSGLPELSHLTDHCPAVPADHRRRARRNHRGDLRKTMRRARWQDSSEQIDGNMGTRSCADRPANEDKPDDRVAR